MSEVCFVQDLSKELEGENSGNFKELLKALCLSPPAYDASEVNRAIKVSDPHTCVLAVNSCHQGE